MFSYIKLINQTFETYFIQTNWWLVNLLNQDVLSVICPRDLHPLHLHPRPLLHPPPPLPSPQRYHLPPRPNRPPPPPPPRRSPPQDLVLGSIEEGLAWKIIKFEIIIMKILCFYATWAENIRIVDRDKCLILSFC